MARKAPPAEEPTLTYDPELGPGYFVQTRTDFLRFPGYSPTFKLLYQILLSYAGAGVKAWPGQVRLATECAISERTVRTVLDDLEAAGLLWITRRGLNLTNAYHLHKLPLELRPLMRDRQNLPVQSGNESRSKAATLAAKVESVQIESAETERPAPPYSGWIYDTAQRHARLLRLAGDVPGRALRAWAVQGGPETVFVATMEQALHYAQHSRGDKARRYWDAVENNCWEG